MTKTKQISNEDKPEVHQTGIPKNPWVATSADFLNVAYGQTKAGALTNLTEV